MKSQKKRKDKKDNKKDNDKENNAKIIRSKLKKGFDIDTIILYPLATEKAINMITYQNKIVFIVDKRATKDMIRSALLKLFKFKPKKINVMIDTKNRKKVYVTMPDDKKALDIATELGIL